MVLLCLILVLVPCALYYYFTRTFYFWKNRNVATPKIIPLFGNIYESAIRRKHMSEVLHNAYKQYPAEKVVGIYRMTTPCLLIRDLDILKHLMIMDFDNFIDRGFDFGKKGLGVNLFHAEGETWKILRKKLTPIFTTAKLRNMFYLMVECGDKFVDYVSKEIDSQPEQEVGSLLQNFFMINISACAFGLDLDPASEEIQTLKKIDKDIFSVNYLGELDMMYPGILKKINRSIFPEYVNDFFCGLVSQVTKLRNNTPSSRKDFMDLILELKLQGDILISNKESSNDVTYLEITENLMAAQAFIFFAAGYETSSTILTFMLYQLALNPDIQINLQSEIDKVLAKHKGEVTYDALQEMEYLEMVFNETLRMYPVLDPLHRIARTRYNIPGTDVVIEKGQTVLVSVFGIHHDESIWPNPHVFDPERFSAENCGKRHPCAFMAFGVGPRNCIGMRFSKISSRVCLVKLLSKFSVKASTNTQRSMKYNCTRFVVTADGGIPLNIVPRM